MIIVAGAWLIRLKWMTSSGLWSSNVANSVFALDDGNLVYADGYDISLPPMLYRAIVDSPETGNLRIGCYRYTWSGVSNEPSLPFLLAMQDRADTVTKLVYADWLEERGRHDEARAQRIVADRIDEILCKAHHAFDLASKQDADRTRLYIIMLNVCWQLYNMPDYIPGSVTNTIASMMARLSRETGLDKLR